MPASCNLTPDFYTMAAHAEVRMALASELSLGELVSFLADMARQEARWNDDGTDTGRWLVTGTARTSITGYTSPLSAPNYPSFSITDPVYRRRHSSPAPAGDFPPLPMDPNHIYGVVTMSETHAKYLQDYEIKGTTSGLSPLGPGRPVTETVITSRIAWVATFLAAAWDKWMGLIP